MGRVAPRVRDAQPDDLAGALASYARNGYGGGIAPDDTVVVAERDGHVVGAVRLAPEQGLLILRGMFLDEPERGRGLGRRMLAHLLPHIRGREAWLITFPRLVRFYGEGGFRSVTPAEEPAFLRERAARYETEHGPQVILRRPATGDGATESDDA